jgi:hypothetical protein
VKLDQSTTTRCYVFVFFCVPQCTDSIQAIDAGIGRSLRIHIGHELDSWLSDDNNLDKWESGFSAAQRRVLMTHLLAKAVKKVNDDDSLRIGAFERTGSLITLLPNLEQDGKIKPQGLSLPYVIPVRQQTPPVPAAEASTTVPPVEQQHASSIESNPNDSIEEEGANDDESVILASNGAVDSCMLKIADFSEELEDGMIELLETMFYFSMHHNSSL